MTNTKLPEKYDAYYDHPGSTCQYPGHMKVQYPNGELHFLPTGTRLFIDGVAPAIAARQEGFVLVPKGLIEAAQDVGMNRFHENPDERDRSLDRLEAELKRTTGDGHE